MQIRTLASTDAGSAAWLLIHAGAPESGPRKRGVGGLVCRLRAFCGPRHPVQDSEPAGLEIHDLQGRRILAVREACPLIEVALPAGTYHVSTHVEGTQRRYTVTLEAGASFDLRVMPARDGPAR